MEERGRAHLLGSAAASKKGFEHFDLGPLSLLSHSLFVTFPHLEILQLASLSSKISDHTLITFTLLPPFQNKTLTLSDQVTCLGALQVQTKSKCLEQARATQHRHLRLPWAPRAAPKSVRVSFCPATCAAAVRADQLQAQVGAGHAYASTSISTQAPTHLSTPRPDFMEQIHITLREKHSNNICRNTH